MINQLFFIYIFLSQFPALLRIGSSYIGLQIFILPIFYLISRNIRTCSNYIFSILFLSAIFGFLKFNSFSPLEFLLRVVSILTVIISIFLPIYLYKKSADFTNFKDKVLRVFLFGTYPTLLFCFGEVLFKFSRNSFILNFLFTVKEEIFVPNRVVHTIGTIAGFFPEHGLFPPFLLFISGISFLFIDKKKFNKIYLFSIFWILILLIHSSGLFISAIAISILSFLILNLFYLLYKSSFSKRLIKFVFLFILIITGIASIWQFYNNYLFNRFALLISNFNSLGFFSFDKTLQFKLLSYYVLLKSNLYEIIFGSGASFFSNLVAEKYKYLPIELISNRLFLSNLNNERFALNSAFMCTLLEYGLFFYLIIILLLRRFCNLFKPIDLFINFSNILRTNLTLNQLISVFLLLSSFLTILGAVPLTYPYPYLSLSILLIIFDCVNNSKRLS